MMEMMSVQQGVCVSHVLYISCGSRGRDVLVQWRVFLQDQGFQSK